MASVQRTTVVVTRPLGQSESLLSQLSTAGFDALEFPLIDIGAVADPAPLRAALDELYAPEPHGYALVMFVSPNAIEHTFRVLGSAWPVNVAIGVVGPGSVAALARQGVSAPAYTVISPPDTVENARFDSEALYAAIEQHVGATGLKDKRVLIVRGDGGREWLADRLAEAGAKVEKVAAYRRIVPEPSMHKWERVHELLAGIPHAWLLTSSEGVRNLDELAREHLTADETLLLKSATLVTPHPRIAEAARQAGFDRITVSGAGDERIVQALLGLRSLHEPLDTHPSAPSSHSNTGSAPTDSRPAAEPAHQPAQSRMTDSNDSNKASSQPSATQPFTQSSAQPLPPNTPFTPYEAQVQTKSRGGSTALLWLVIVILAVAAGVGGFLLNRKFEHTDQQFAQRLQAADAQNADLTAKADEAASAVHALDTQVVQLEGKLNDARTQNQALQQQYQDLASNRDDWTLAEVEQILSSASQQLQLTGNVQLALFALQSADTRLAASNAGAQIVTIRRAIAEDMDRLKATPTTDLTGLAIKLDTAIGQIDTLPLAGEAPITPAAAHAAAPGNAASIAAATGQPVWKVWWQQIAGGIGQQLKSLVSVRRIDNADAMLASPDQGYFVRENVKLRLLSARLSLLSRSEATLKSDLHAADTALGRYFDASSPRVQSVRDLVKQVDQASMAVTLPDLSASLAAVHQFKRGG
jgi:uroporphyrinogen III methyltransferase/synthase